MSRNIGWILFHSFDFLMEVLFLYGLCINMTAFYYGISGGWVALFTLMIMSGSILMYLFLNVLFKDHQDDENILKHSYLLDGLLLTVISLVSHWKVGLVVFICNIVIYLIPKKMLKVIFEIMSWLIISFFSLFSYQKGWIEMSRCLLIILSQFLLYKPIRKENKKEESSDTKTRMTITFISCCVICMILYLFSQIEIAIIHIANEGDLYKLSKCAIWFIFLGVVLVCYVIGKFYMENTKRLSLSKKETVVSEHMIFVVLMTIYAIKLFPASWTISMIILMICISYLAFEYLMIAFAHMKKETFQVARWIMSHLMICVLFISAQILYDSVNIDTSVVMMCALMMIVIRMYVCAMNEYQLNEVEVQE